MRLRAAVYDLAMPYADVNGQRVHFLDSGGGGTPLVLGHGFLMDHEMFAPQVAALGGRFRVVAWDARGHGETVTSPEDFSYWDLAEDLRALLDTLGIERAVVGGVSQGGFVALRFALRYPERVLGLVLIDSQAGLEDPEKAPQYDMMVEVWTTQGPTDMIAEATAAIIIGADCPQSPEWMAKWRARPKEQVKQPYRTLMSRDDITDRLGEITAPALVIHGEEDVAIEMSRAETLAAGLQHARPLVRVPGAGHASNLTHPEPVNAAIDRFLREL